MRFPLNRVYFLVIEQNHRIEIQPNYHLISTAIICRHIDIFLQPSVHLFLNISKLQVSHRHDNPLDSPIYNSLRLIIRKIPKAYR